MRNPGGTAIWTGQGRPIERDTFTCPHCNTVVFVKPMASPTEMGGYCGCCHAPICPGCVGKPCIPFEKQLEASERRGRDQRHWDEILGGDR